MSGKQKSCLHSIYSRMLTRRPVICYFIATTTVKGFNPGLSGPTADDDGLSVWVYIGAAAGILFVIVVGFVVCIVGGFMSDEKYDSSAGGKSTIPMTPASSNSSGSTTMQSSAIHTVDDAPVHSYAGASGTVRGGGANLEDGSSGTYTFEQNNSATYSFE